MQYILVYIFYFLFPSESWYFYMLSPQKNYFYYFIFRFWVLVVNHCFLFIFCDSIFCNFLFIDNNEYTVLAYWIKELYVMLVWLLTSFYIYACENDIRIFCFCYCFSFPCCSLSNRGKNNSIEVITF